MNILDRILRTVYPLACVACDRPVSRGHGVCEDCAESFEPTFAACPRCARPFERDTNVPCARCLTRRSSLTSCTAAFEYGGQLARALQRLKFSRRSDIARSLAPLLQEAFDQVAARCDLAVPVPLHWRRLRKRGFNQSARILAPLAKQSGIAATNHRLVRKHHTKTQTSLSRSRRIANVRGAFVCKPLTATRVLLLDDIRTTGATLEEAAKALRRAGAREIHGFVVARTEWEG